MRGSAASHGYVSGDLTLDVTATESAARTTLPGFPSVVEFRGLGVWSLSGDQFFHDAYFVDGAPLPEALIFSFGSEVQIRSITFEVFDQENSFRWFSGNSGWSGETAIVGSGPLVDYAFGTPLTGTTFGFGTGAPTSAFKISAIGVSPVAAVPLPPALVLLVGAIAALALLKRTLPARQTA